MMCDIEKAIAQADAYELDKILKAVLKRYAELFPDWEVGTISLQKSADRNKQIDRMITMLQNMKS